MKIIFSKILLLIFLTPLVSYSNSINQQDLNQIEDELTSFYEKARLPLQPQFKFYHYFNYSWNDPIVDSFEAREELARQHAQIRMNFFWYPNPKSNNAMAAGPGLYAAVDPYSSKSYGNTILQIKLKPGFFYVPKKISSKICSNEFLKKMDRLSQGSSSLSYCNRYSAADLGYNFLMNSNINDSTINGIFKRIFKKLNIVASEYVFSSSTYSICGKNNDSAMVFFSQPEVDGGIETNLSIFDFKLIRNDFKNLSWEELQDSQETNEFLKYLSKPFNSYGWDSSKLKIYLESLNINEEKYKTWVGSTLTCY